MYGAVVSASADDASAFDAATAAAAVSSDAQPVATDASAVSAFPAWAPAPAPVGWTVMSDGSGEAFQVEDSLTIPVGNTSAVGAYGDPVSANIMSGGRWETSLS